jgi:hypothetical protein
MRENGDQTGNDPKGKQIRLRRVRSRLSWSVARTVTYSRIDICMRVAEGTLLLAESIDKRREVPKEPLTAVATKEAVEKCRQRMEAWGIITRRLPNSSASIAGKARIAL